MKIREISLSDTAAFTQLCKETFIDTYAAYNTVEDMQHYVEMNFTENVISQELQNDSLLFFCIEWNNELIAYIKLNSKSFCEAASQINSLEVARLYVKKEFQHKNFGKLLIGKAVEEAVRLKKQGIWLGVWQQNEKAITFYEKQGFEKIGVAKFLLGADWQDDWIMMKLLT